MFKSCDCDLKYEIFNSIEQNRYIIFLTLTKASLLLCSTKHETGCRYIKDTLLVQSYALLQSLYHCSQFTLLHLNHLV